VNGYLVDTNIPSDLTRRQPDVRVADFIRKAGKENLFLSGQTPASLHAEESVIQREDWERH